jgi:DeoR/GlpR family transcriptional regulator of sugar metabolism
MMPAQRRRLIVRQVRSGEGAQVAELARQLGVSAVTVRRDLAALAREGRVTRVHGGAIGGVEATPLAVAPSERCEGKVRVGHSAAGLVPENALILIDIGTTSLELARSLHGRHVTVITANLAVVEELLPDAAIELVVLGGVVRRAHHSLVGALTEDALRQVSADIAFLGASGIRRDDLAVMDTTMVEVPVKRAMLAAARKKVLLVDGAKLGAGGTMRVCDARDFDAIVTDAPADDPVVLALVQAGVRVIPA